ncbi:helix-turn-helix domain-containing protein [Pseudomonas violetae]|uniref:Helix-turn-helix domain-containing protein n=1 Tax=Pseudomonas violetae TaxID=2915813 RepID=A0ABT0F7T9_9PSED|nr:helix-turn-helix domain-containing protein [Pseudomonas violetae]MCK1794090.1 helix-turn-helix domain-containing protein [Pseudomonas violetae]
MEETCPKLLTKQELDSMSARMGANADQWLEKKLKPTKARKPKADKAIRRPPKVVANPFAGYLMRLDDYQRCYPLFAMDIIEGIARLDWHNRDIGQGGVSKPLSVRRIITVLEWLPEITNEAVQDLLNLGERHARRYVKAVELAIPRMMKCRPDSLRFEMDGIEAPRKSCDWDDELLPPTPEELAKLHHDLRTFTEYGTADKYERQYPAMPVGGVVVALPKRELVRQMLAEGKSVKAIEREVGITAKTIRRWREEGQAA